MMVLLLGAARRGAPGLRLPAGVTGYALTFG
jgi:hypothetical protein